MRCAHVASIVLMSRFLLAYWLGICVKVDVDIINLSFSELFDDISLMLNVRTEDYAWLWIVLSVPRKCVVVMCFLTAAAAN